jgi:hypothetical protein
MIRMFGLAGLIASVVGLLFALGGLAGDQPGGLPPLKKLDPATDNKAAEPPEKKLDSKVPPDKQPPKGEPPTKPLKKTDKAEDPREVMARIVKNMEIVEEHLNKGKTGKDTQSVQKKIIDDLEKLIEEQQDKSKSDQQNQQSKDKSEQKKTGAGQQNGGMEDPNPMKQPGDAKQQPVPNPDKDKNNKAGGQATNVKVKDPKSQSTVGKIINMKDTWGHLPKEKRLEMDAYSHEQFMPQYEQLLRQYYQTIAAQAKSKGKD